VCEAVNVAEGDEGCNVGSRVAPVPASGLDGQAHTAAKASPMQKRLLTGCKTFTNLVLRLIRPDLDLSYFSRPHRGSFLGSLTFRRGILDSPTPTMCPLSKLLFVPPPPSTILKGPASLPAADGPSRFSPTTVRDWQPRRKSVSNACERCRRRKIRCDGDTPCATCRRFMLQCVRTQKPREIVAS
jgi:hypothetical protein